VRQAARIWILAVALLVIVPLAAWACPVCFSGSPRIRIAFFNTTLLLSFLPLGLIGAAVFALKRLGRGSWAGEFEDRDSI
jgi:hypothetical protein